MSVEYGPWIDNDGTTAPVGMYVMVEYFDGGMWSGRVHQFAIYPEAGTKSRWLHDGTPRNDTVRRYRMVIPTALEVLRDIAHEPSVVLPPDGAFWPEKRNDIPYDHR